MRLDVKNGLKHDPDAPEHRDILAEPASQAATARELTRVEDAERRKRDDRQDDVTAVHPVHLAVEPRKAPQLFPPVQPERNKRGSDQHSELRDARKEDQPREGRVHQIAPRARMNGTISPTTNGRWNNRRAG